MTTQLALSNIINISVSQGNLGVNAYNTSNLAIFTGESPGTGFPGAGFQIYLTPAAVATDFGSSSVTYKMANAVFSQQPNILAGGGYLVVITYTSSETLAAAITRTSGLVQYFGCMSEQIESQVDMLAAAAVIQALNKILFVAQYDSADIAPGGSLDLLRTGAFSQTRGLFYGDSTGSPAGINALLFQAGYAGRGLSVNFNGSNTTLTMALKTIVGSQPDPTLTQTLYNEAQTAGADCYPSFQGDAACTSFGANSYFDDVYNLQWFVGALQVAGFNYLAQTGTKIPQTENGMDGLKGAYATVCQQAVTNQYVAPGAWNSATTFGNQASLISNVANVGYYIFSTPIAQQLQATRVTRAAPLVQIAIKAAGAIQSSTVVVNVNP